MDLPKVITLHKQNYSPAVSIRLTGEVILHFQSLQSQGKSPKLLVKNGQFFIKITDLLIFPCTQLQEYLNLDIYTKPLEKDDYVFSGKIKSKLAVTDAVNPKISGSKLDVNITAKSQSSTLGGIQNAARNSSAGTGPAKPDSIPPHASPKRANPVYNVSRGSTSTSTITLHSTPATPISFDPYRVSPSDSKQDQLDKLLYFVALGPCTKNNLVTNLRFLPAELDSWLTTYCQTYNPKDPLLASASFINTVETGAVAYVLRDKAYKDLRPHGWKYYSGQERDSVLANIHMALTRLGYLETHPLRSKIEDSLESKKTANLGGGLLISKKTSPFKKSQTDSPRIAPTTSFASTNTSGSGPSPLRHVKELKKRQLSSNSSSSSDDENKRFKKDDTTSPSSINDDTDEELDKSKNNHYTNLYSRFKLRYKEYQQLYRELEEKSPNDPKRALAKLFELHQILLDWKKQLQIYDKEVKSKSSIMNLSKHKKKGSDAELLDLAPRRLRESKGLKPALNY